MLISGTSVTEISRMSCLPKLRKPQVVRGTISMFVIATTREQVILKDLQWTIISDGKSGGKSNIQSENINFQEYSNFYSL